MKGINRKNKHREHATMSNVQQTFFKALLLQRWHTIKYLIPHLNDEYHTALEIKEVVELGTREELRQRYVKYLRYITRHYETLHFTEAPTLLLKQLQQQPADSCFIEAFLLLCDDTTPTDELYAHWDAELLVILSTSKIEQTVSLLRGQIATFTAYNSTRYNMVLREEIRRYTDVKKRETKTSEYTTIEYRIEAIKKGTEIIHIDHVEIGDEVKTMYKITVIIE